MAVLGIIEVAFQGRNIPIKPGGTLRLGGVVNSPVVFGQTVAPAGKMMASEISVKAVLQTGDSIAAMLPSGQGELQVSCDTGQMFIFANAFVEDAPTLTAGDNSEIDVKFSAGTYVEVTGG